MKEAGCDSFLSRFWYQPFLTVKSGQFGPKDVTKCGQLTKQMFGSHALLFILCYFKTPSVPWAL